MRLFDAVELVTDLPEDGLAAGAVGTIVDEYPGQDAWEVEFSDENGRTLALVALRGGQIRPMG